VTLGFPLWLRVLHLLNLLLIAFIIRAGIQILADHPRLNHDAGCYPGREILRLRGPVPPERMKQDPPERAWTAKDDAVTLPGWLARPARDTALDRPGPLVALQLRPAMGHHRRGVLRAAVQHRPMAPADSGQLEHLPQRGLDRDTVRLAELPCEYRLDAVQRL